MFNINYTHTSNSGSSAKQFRFIGEAGMTIEAKVPNQARQIVDYIYNLTLTVENFTYQQLADYIDEQTDNFTTSKGGTMRIIRYYSKLLQEIGIITAA